MSTTIPDPPKIGQAMSAAFISQIRQKLQPTFDGLYAGKTPTGTSLPTIAKDGDTLRVKLLASATGATSDVSWTLVYDAATAYWYPQGAPALIAFTAASFASSSTAAFQDSATPKITVPFAGDYELDWSAICNQSAAGTVWPARTAAIQNGSTGPTVYAEGLVAAATTETIAGFESALAVPVSAAITVAVYTNDGTPAHTTWTQRWVRVRPIRVH